MPSFLIATTFLVLALAKLNQTGRGAWWLAIGIAFGIGMFSKYTTIFFAPSILIWLLLVPEQRRWLLTPWPWIAGVIAIAIFSPTLIWNAQHGWASVLYQYNRLVVHEWSLRYLGEFIGAQIGMATPFVFVLGVMGLAAMLRGQGGSFSARVLINAMLWPILLYFVWHTFHGRVEGNWPEPMFVPFVIAAGVAAERITWEGIWAKVESISQRLAVPVALAIAAVIYAQGVFGIARLGMEDPTASKLGAGWKELGAQMDEVRKRMGAPIILVYDYGLASWLSFYLPSHAPVEQINLRMRYVNAPEPDPKLFDLPEGFKVVDRRETAFSYRDAKWSMVMVGVDPDPANAEKITAWTKDYWAALHPYSLGGAYVNFMMEEGIDRIKATYRDNYDRLVEIKRKYDPDNFFHINQNIGPK